MDISFYCEECGQHIVVDQGGAGLNIACPGCQQSLTIPAQPQSATPPVLLSPLPAVAPAPITKRGSSRIAWLFLAAGMFAGVVITIGAVAVMWHLSTKGTPGTANHQLPTRSQVSKTASRVVRQQAPEQMLPRQSAQVKRDDSEVENAASPNTKKADLDELKWQKDWTEFGRKLARTLGISGATLRDADIPFAGKQVEWVGEVATISHPDAKQKYGSILMKMAPIRFFLGEAPHIDFTGGILPPAGHSDPASSEVLELNEISLTPENEREWKSWARCQVGTRAAFRTTLTNSVLPTFPVLLVFRGAGPNTGQVRVVLNTQGAEMLQVRSNEQKPGVKLGKGSDSSQINRPEAPSVKGVGS